MRVRLGNLQFKVEDSALIGGALWAPYVGVPEEQIMFKRSSSNPDRRDGLFLDDIKILEQALRGEVLSLRID